MSGPDTGGPGGPTTPSGPAATPTPGPRTGGPSAVSAGPVGPRRGTPMVLTHGRTAKRLLEIDWDHAVYVPPDRGQQTAAVGPLTAEQAIAYLAGADKRPLLVLRECSDCQGTDLALLRADAPNERTLLLTDFFHCVRLAPSVATAGHPFSRLFTSHSHLFLCDADGGERIDLSGKQSQSELLAAMRKVIARNSEVDPTSALNKLQQALAQLDRIDAKEVDAIRALEAELERRGDKSARVAELQKRARELAEERDGVLAEIRELRTTPR